MTTSAPGVGTSNALVNLFVLLQKSRDEAGLPLDAKPSQLWDTFLGSCNEEGSDLEQNGGARQKDRGELEIRLLEVDKEMASNEDAYLASKEDRKAQEDKVSSLRKEVDALKEKHTELSKLKVDKEQGIQRIESQLTEMGKKRKRLELERRELEMMEEAEHDRKINAMIKKNRRRRSELDEKELEKRNLEEQNENLTKAIKEIRKKYKKAEKIKENYMMIYDNLKSLIETLETGINGKKTRLDTLKSKCKQLDQAIQEKSTDQVEKNNKFEAAKIELQTKVEEAVSALETSRRKLDESEERAATLQEQLDQQSLTCETIQRLYSEQVAGAKEWERKYSEAAQSLKQTESLLDESEKKASTLQDLLTIYPDRI